MEYTLSAMWRLLVDDVREGRLVSPTKTVVWTNGTKHGIEEGSVSRDIIAFMNRQTNQTSTRDNIMRGLPTAFQRGKKVPKDLAQEYLRELVKMGILRTENADNEN